ncbi:DUF2441 domain-containing protein [Bacillus sp. FJAT-49732]|uniref:DUF2441 domain-containing protein n=1 Tax=Lederbergia citrisecunda TaxID=2833583 RepID=A0A942TIM2_9BACI|nr:DUF2441 domain-containing protein [Lederbergia citrisecunda]MBS4198325.1 DUF2441 domain-containing protein [Lederbergia citrisecunda]
MQYVEDHTLYHINCMSDFNLYSQFKIGDVIDTSRNYNPFRNNYEIGSTSLNYAEECAKTYWRFTKEFAIEQTRSQINEDLPSRWRSLWLSDKEHLDYWKSQFVNEEFQIVKLNLNGKIFLGDAHWIEIEPSPLLVVREKAINYWTGNIFRGGKMEYLFEGIAKVVSLV